MKPPNPELMTQWQSWFAHCSWPSRITGAIRDAQEATAREVARLEALRTRAASCVFCIVHEAPYRAGTGYLAAENVRRYNATGDPFCYYVVPRTDARQTEGFRWHNDVPVIVCAPEGLQDLVTRYQPKVVEFHHTKGWAPDVLGVRVPGEKHLYLHDSMLWCWRVWSFDGRDVCNEPGPEKCRECAGVPAERTVARDESLRRVLPEFQRIIANSDYTAHHARLQLNVPVEVQLPNPPLRTRPFRGKKIGYFGRFDPIKGVHILLEAATKMP
ncbi:MAG TPA: hypothetical protein VFO89_00060, partial [Thermoanaerobaculia bacterium]|nr:hypothetical protein [Thermoanaerobaculia bacterium]